MMVSITMASHHDAPQPWKVESVPPMRLNRGSRRFLKKSSMLQSFPLSSRVWCRAQPQGGGALPLHPAAEAGQENDERAEKECDEDGKVARFATNAGPYYPRPKNPCGDAAGGSQGARASGDAEGELADTTCRAEEREYRKAEFQVGVDLFPGKEGDEQPD